MGLRLFGGSFSSYDSRQDMGTVFTDVPRIPPVLPNPNPSNYKIVRHLQHGRALIVEILYPDCTNYEGRKVLLFLGTTMSDLEKQGTIDPHFSENTKFISPIARFEPTQRGWAMAYTVAEGFYE